MKKILLVLGLVTLTTNVSFASISLNLKYGAKGQEVTELQEILIDKGFLIGQATGNFFTLTRKAVIAYQASVGLPATGYVGPMTRKVINDELALADLSTGSAEASETGTTTPLVQASSSSDLLSQQVANLAAQVAEQKRLQEQANAYAQQIAQNTAPVVTPVQAVVTPVATPEIVKTSFNCNCMDIATDFTSAAVWIEKQSGTVSVTFNGQTTTKTIGDDGFKTAGKNSAAAFTFATGLTPNTEYTATLRLDRRTDYSEKTVTFRTSSLVQPPKFFFDVGDNVSIYFRTGKEYGMDTLPSISTPQIPRDVDAVLTLDGKTYSTNVERTKFVLDNLAYDPSTLSYEEKCSHKYTIDFKRTVPDVGVVTGKYESSMCNN